MNIISSSYPGGSPPHIFFEQINSFMSALLILENNKNIHERESMGILSSVGEKFEEKILDNK